MVALRSKSNIDYDTAPDSPTDDVFGESDDDSSCCCKSKTQEASSPVENGYRCFEAKRQLSNTLHEWITYYSRDMISSGELMDSVMDEYPFLPVEDLVGLVDSIPEARPLADKPTLSPTQDDGAMQ
mmetsp:Transcript_6985/g.12164  ORF Transcript_6985/g.12164 Transcript_6985/m.12164 type:complete len:126 (-) Transcript_6985:108-485(-)